MERSYALPPNRSISLPSTLHPTSLRVEAELIKLRAWELRSCLSLETLTAETIQTGLVGLSEVYRCAEELVYSSLTHHANVLESALDHSVKLLDTYGIVRDMKHKIKEQALCLQSSIRRRCKDSLVKDEVLSYLILRKKLNKEASKCIRSLKRSERKFTVTLSLKDNTRFKSFKYFLTQVNVMMSRVLRIILVFLSSPGGINKKRRSGCSLISKLRPTEKARKISNEVGSVDGALFSVLHGTEDMTMADRKLENLVISLDSIETGLDVVFRRLIRYRVSVLNVLTQ